MKIYKKRIAFLISDQHFIPHGGIGQFAKGFTEMCNDLEWKIDIILDKAPTNEHFVNLFTTLGANLVYPDQPISYSDHTGTFAFSDSVNLEKITNFRKAILESFQKNLYDMFICNSQESMTAAYIMALTKDIPLVFYSHLHSMIFRQPNGNDVFLECYHHFFNKHMEFPDALIGTQTILNKMALENNGSKFVSVLPMPISERGLLIPNTQDRNGVLFIGRWEEGKNPEAYVRVMKESGLPCKVMTSVSSKKKFEKAFEEAGITDYDIRTGITGDEKVEFIKSSKVFFCPSLRESYGLAFYECIGHMPCVALDIQDWTDNFESIYYFKTSLEEASDLIKILHADFNPISHYKTDALNYVKMLNELAFKSWQDFLHGYQGRQSTSNQATLTLFQVPKT